MDAETRSTFLKEAAERDLPNLVSMTARELLDLWSYKRRGSWIIGQIERELAAAGLTTDPPFQYIWIDSPVRLVPTRLEEGTGETEVEDEATSSPEGSAPSTEVTLHVGRLGSANRPVCSVPLDSPLIHAQSLMMRYDYSQLAITSDGRNLRGAITWESIARASMRGTPSQVVECRVDAESVRSKDDLIRHIPRIVQAGYVFVRSHDESLCGIVTTADLSEEFATLAAPFFLIGEIERRLRRAVDRVFTPDELNVIRDPADSGRAVASAEDLTMGEYIRLLEEPARWARMDWPVERQVFGEFLDQVRQLRNDVLHFSPDPLDEEELDVLRRFIALLRFLDPR
jgi:restriction system protein